MIGHHHLAEFLHIGVLCILGGELAQPHFQHSTARGFLDEILVLVGETSRAALIAFVVFIRCQQARHGGQAKRGDQRGDTKRQTSIQHDAFPSSGENCSPDIDTIYSEASRTTHARVRRVFPR